MDVAGREPGTWDPEIEAQFEEKIGDMIRMGYRERCRESRRVLMTRPATTPGLGGSARVCVRIMEWDRYGVNHKFLLLTEREAEALGVTG